jgi:hypothetical protein
VEIFLSSVETADFPCTKASGNATHAKVARCVSKARDANGEAKKSLGPIYTFKRAHKGG